MTVGEVFEPPFAFSQSLIDGLTRIDDAQQVVVVVAEFQLDGSHVRRISGDHRSRLGLVAVMLDQRLETQALQAMCDGAAVPSQDVGRGLHVKGVLSQTLQNCPVTGGIRERGRRPFAVIATECVTE